MVVAAAGNRGTDADAVSYAPGNDPYVISVGALDDQASQADGDDSRATWSSRGVTQDGFAKPEIHAPGARIVSTLAPGSAFATLCPTCIVQRPDDPRRRHLDVGADGLGRGGPAAAEVPEPDAEPGQGRPRSAPRAWSTTASRRWTSTRAIKAVAAGNVPVANQGLTPNTLVSAANGDIDYSRSSWSRSSWSAADSSLGLDFARSSWSRSSWSSTNSDGVEVSRSSWSRSSWSTSWTK